MPIFPEYLHPFFTMHMFRIFYIITFFIIFGSLQAQVPTSAQPTIDSLSRLLKQSREDSTRVLLYMDLLNTYIDFDLKEAEAIGWKANALSKKINFPLGEGRTYFSLGNIARYNGNMDTCDSLFLLAEKVFRNINNKEKLAIIDNERGSMHFNLGNYWLAADYYAKAAETFEQLNDTISYIISYQNLISVLGETENITKAISLAQKILPTARLTTDTSQVFYIMQSLLTHFTKTGQLDSARNYVSPLLKAAGETADFYIATDIYHAVGNYFLARKQYKEALKYNLVGLEKANLLKNDFLVTRLQLAVGASYLLIQERKKALPYLLAALQMADKSSNRWVSYEGTRLLSQYYEQDGQYKLAYAYINRHLQLKDSIRDARVSNHVNYLEALYENNKKEKQINTLTLKNTQKELQLVKRNRALYMGSAGAAFMMLGLGFLYRRSNHKKVIAEKEQEMQKEQIKFLERQQQVVSLQSMVNGQETERSRIARDLHDGLGGLFSTVKMYFSTLEHEQQQLKENELFKKSYEMVDTAATEVRRIAHNMMPEVLLKMGLIQALNDLCGNITASRLLKVSLQVNGMEERLGHSTEIMLYRIVQELLNNIAKHAQATEAIVQFIREDNRLSVTVEDNGKGFNTDAADSKKQAGLESVKNRVDYLNGKISIESQSNIGTTVMMDFLLQQ
jgi:signal transduction histidine kinase